MRRQRPGAVADSGFEDRAAGREFVDPRAGLLGISITAQVIRPERIDCDQQHIGPALIGQQDRLLGLFRGIGLFLLSAGGDNQDGGTNQEYSTVARDHETLLLHAHQCGRVFHLRRISTRMLARIC